MEHTLSTQPPAVRTSSVTVERVGEQSQVTRVLSQSPLRVLTPSNHGDAAWLFLSSLGGGFVGTDSLSLEMHVGDGATVWFSSQASSKAYRACDSTFELKARVEGNGVLLVWPDAVTCFADASLRQTQRVDLSAQASVLWVDVLSAGRVSQGERWAFKSFASRLFIDVAGQPWLRESTLLAADQGSLNERMAGLEAVATVVLVGPSLLELSRTLEARIAERPARAPVLVSASAREGGLLIRVAAASLEALTVTLRELLREAVVERLGDDPFARKW